MDFSIVVPAKNEQDNIEPLIREIRSSLDGRFGYELIYVDDGSTDDTSTRLRQIKQAGFPRLRILRHQASCGQSAAICTGVKAARAPWIVTLDADGQNDPVDIPKIVAPLLDPKRDSDLVATAGIRVKRQDHWLKLLSSRIANAVRGWLLKDGTPDTGCGLKAFSREAFLELPHFDHMHRFLPALFQRAGGKVFSMPVNHRPRVHGRSHYGVRNRLWVSIVDMLGVVWLNRRAKRPVALPEL